MRNPRAFLILSAPLLIKNSISFRLAKLNENRIVWKMFVLFDFMIELYVQSLV